VVDDDPAVVRVIGLLLKRAGYDPITATSATEATQHLDQPVQALVLDLRIPGMRGDAFYFLASTRQPWLTGRALFITGDISEQAEQIVAQTGCALLPKPFTFDQLYDAMLSVVPPSVPRCIPRVG
jgi:two-component system cell cycle sensor histidine kinase/response regulator CckA